MRGRCHSVGSEPEFQGMKIGLKGWFRSECLGDFWARGVCWREWTKLLKSGLDTWRKWKKKTHQIEFEDLMERDRGRGKGRPRRRWMTELTCRRKLPESERLRIEASGMLLYMEGDEMQ